LEQVKTMIGVRWWIEGDIQGFFDHLNHSTLLRLLNRRIKDNRFLHLIEQFLRAGYIEDWTYHKTYTGTPQGGSLSPLLSNIYLHELDTWMQQQIAQFNKGKVRALRKEYIALRDRKARAKTRAQRSGNWTEYKILQQEMSHTPCADPQDPNYRRLRYVRYADDFLIGINGSKADAEALKRELAEFLKTELQLELSLEKTLVTNAKERVRFLGYDIQRWRGIRVLKVSDATRGMVRQRTTNFHLKLILPKDKMQAFAQEYGSINKWESRHRNRLLHLSELEIMMIYNAEIRGFLNYYALADNLSAAASKLLWLTTNSFLKTIGAKCKQSRQQVVQRLKTGANAFTIVQPMPDGSNREYRLVSSTQQVQRKKITHPAVDLQAVTSQYRNNSDLIQRLLAQECEWCGRKDGQLEVHHVRRLKDLKGKAAWEVQMIARRRKTMILCLKCHHDLHNGKLR